MKYLGKGKCCAETTPSQVQLSCEYSSGSSFCPRPLNYLGDGKCCSSRKNLECTTSNGASHCTGDGFLYLGDGKCCVETTASPLPAPEQKSGAWSLKPWTAFLAELTRAVSGPAIA